jgi:hypothetical protein
MEFGMVIQNIYPFTATGEITAIIQKLQTPIDFAFVRFRSVENPLYAINRGFASKGHQVRLCIYGEGIERKLRKLY